MRLQKYWCAYINHAVPKCPRHVHHTVEYGLPRENSFSIFMGFDSNKEKSSVQDQYSIVSMLVYEMIPLPMCLSLAVKVPIAGYSPSLWPGEPAHGIVR